MIINLTLTDDAILTIKFPHPDSDFVLCAPPPKAAHPLYHL